MKRFLLAHLVCPFDGQPLDLIVFSEDRLQIDQETKNRINAHGNNPVDFESEIMNGLLVNLREKKMYPIFQGVPRLLLFEHPLITQFEKSFAPQLKEYLDRGFNFPSISLVPGEKNVLASFSSEWTDYGYNEEAYWGQTAEVYNNSLYSTLQNETQNLVNRTVLEVGIGSGGSANAMSEKFGCNIIGVDLGYSVDVAFKNFGHNPFFQIVQASAFHLPFRDDVFDFVYSHGVIHHTFDTRKAFDQLSRLPKKGGRLYVWVYSFLNESRTTKRKMIMLLERIIRPWCSELPGWMQTVALLPIVPLYIFHQNSEYKGKPGMAKYNWREAMHAARDRFTPKYIHRHSEEEVINWFRNNNFDRIGPLSAKKLPDYVPAGFYMNTGVEGFKL